MVWSITIPGKPWSLNRERTAHWTARRDHNEYWTRHAAHAAKIARIPRLERIGIEAWPTHKGRLQDAGNCYPSVKAAIDGIVLAGIIPDDNPQHLSYITMRAPQKGEPAIVLVLFEVITDEPEIDLAGVRTPAKKKSIRPTRAPKSRTPRSAA